jgi:hypothetical protein
MSECIAISLKERADSESKFPIAFARHFARYVVTELRLELDLREVLPADQIMFSMYRQL